MGRVQLRKRSRCEGVMRQASPSSAPLLLSRGCGGSETLIPPLNCRPRLPGEEEKHSPGWPAEGCAHPSANVLAHTAVLVRRHAHVRRAAPFIVCAETREEHAADEDLVGAGVKCLRKRHAPRGDISRAAESCQQLSAPDDTIPTKTHAQTVARRVTIVVKRLQVLRSRERDGV